MSKILLISHIFPPAIDGGSRVIYKIGQQFQAQGHTIFYLSSNCSSTDDFIRKKYPKFKKQTPNQIKLPIYTSFYKPFKFVCLFIPKNTYLHQFLKTCQKGPIFKLFPFLKTTVKIIKFKPNLIVAGPLPTTIVLYASFLKKIINIHVNFFSFFHRLKNNSCQLLINSSFHFTDLDFYSKPLIKTLQIADYLWTLTKFETNYFIKNFRINPNKIILAGNGVDYHFLSNKPKYENHQSTILFIGSFAAHKRIDLLINAFSSILSQKPELQNSLFLTIAGQKTLFYPQIKKTVNTLPIQIKSKIKFIFNFPQKKLATLIDDCIFLVLPSIQESFGLVLLETWARGKPVITSDIPSLSELVTNCQGGLTFKQDNLIDLKIKLIKLINSSILCNQYGQNGLKYVKTNYIWEKVSQKICQKLKLS